ncbi:MAG: hypothetical protein SGILL_003457 [Bacillariaceae sp.]
MPEEKDDGQPKRIAFNDPTVKYAVDLLEQNVDTIRDEYLKVAPSLQSDYDESMGGHSKDTLHAGQWDWHSYMNKGSIQGHFCTHFPKTAEILHEGLRTRPDGGDRKNHPDEDLYPHLLFEGTPFGFSFFSTLSGKSKIQAHTAPMNLRLRLHLPLIVPKSNNTTDTASNVSEASSWEDDRPACGIRVGPLVREWKEGSALVLDDSYNHEVWNDTDESRVILLVDIWHPDIPPVEKKAIVDLFQKAQQDGFAVSLCLRKMHPSEASIAPNELATVELPQQAKIAATAEVENQKDRMPNFRKVGCFDSYLYRSSCPDDVSEALPTEPQQSSVEDDLSAQQLSEPEYFLLHDATLWIDMRFAKEIDENKLDSILLNAPGGSFERLTFDDPRGMETALKSMLDESRNRRLYLSHYENPLFSEPYFLKYVQTNWVSPEALANCKDKNEQKMLLAKAIVGKGLFGLNEAILECHKLMAIALQAITVHLEQWDEVKEGRPPRVLIHCTLGKDRTGNLSMLCQHMVGATDQEIVDDYARSRCIRDVAMKVVKNYLDGKVDLSCYADCDAHTMRKTLTYLREKYGGIDGYLDAIGFDSLWRQRFVRVTK